jgi:spore maturation protein CgeB
MGFVGTDKSYRKRGFIKELNKIYEQIMEEKGYLLSVIRGIPYFYRKLGYEFSFPLDNRFVLPKSKVPSQDLNHITIRSATHNDLEFIKEKYEEYHRNLLFWNKFWRESFKFKYLNSNKIYDFAFTGNLHKRHIDIRTKIKNEIFRNPSRKTNLKKIPFLKNPIKKKYQEYKIYWAEWGARDIFFRSLVPTGAKYFIFLNKCKTMLNTPSAIGIINTRFFNCMATKTIIICPESPFYGSLIKDGFNAIFFKKDISNFNEILDNIINNHSTRNKIAEQAFKDVLENHTYRKRIERLMNEMDLDN